ncbi:hypothetical protein ACHAXN_013223 [Cyclotella atomus]
MSMTTSLLPTLLLYFLPSLTTLTPFALTAAQEFLCPGPPSAGCTNGMFLESICGCVCISPFCPDSMGDCTVPGGGCTDQQITGDCTRGVDCPWWVNGLKAESCITGNNVPAGMWNVYGSQKDCCAVNFPFSEVCYVEAGTSAPTKYPTLAVPQESAFETVPMLFSVQGLPDDLNVRELKDEMKQVLLAILQKIAGSISDMRLSSIEEREVRKNKDRNRDRRLGGGGGGGGDDSEEKANQEEEKAVDNNYNHDRFLLRNVDFYYDINLIRVPDKQFGPIIIQEMKDTMPDIQNLIETTKTKYFQADVDVNFCTLSSGKYNLCTSTPQPVKRPVQATAMAEPEPEAGGLPGWAVALIVIFVLALVGGMGYLMYISSRDGDVYDKEMEDMYADEMKSAYSRKSRGGRSFRSGSSRRSSRSGRSRSSRSRRSGTSSRRSGSRSRYSRRSSRSKKSRGENSGMVLTIAQGGEDPAFGDEFTVDTYKTAKKRRPDPSIYNPNAVDPDGGMTDGSGVLMLTMGEDPDASIGIDGHRRYMEDPPLKPKREPTMYVDGHAGEDASLYSAKYGQGSIGSANRYADAQSLEDPFGDYPAKQASMYMGASDGEFQRGAKDPSFYQPPGAGDRSFHTQDPSVGDKSGKSKKSSRSRASIRRHVEESLASSWGDVMDGMGEMKQKSKSFY